jgi:tetratricopeptide (TPR) repeat protein
LVTGSSVWIVKSACALKLLLLSLSSQSFAQESNAPALPPVGQLEEKNSREALQVLREIDEQLRSNWMAIEQNGKDAQEASLRNTEVLSNGWRSVEAAFSAQQEGSLARTARELEAIESSKRVTLAVAAAFASIAALTLLILAYFQWRMSKTWAELLAALPLGLHRGPTILTSTDPAAIPATPLEDSNRRLLGVIEQLERRLEGLEHSSIASLKPHDRDSSSGDNGDLPGLSRGSTSTVTTANDRISVPLSNGTSMLKSNQLERAITCFDEVLLIDPNHGEALVKKGVALERLKKLNEAFECYDRAIAADASLTIAYLHKGGLCNRLERFKEALDCYEKALQTHHA